MADTSNLTNFLEDIADAIRTKKSTTEEIPAANFDTEILSIETGVDTSDATATEKQILRGYTAYTKTGKTTGTFYGAKLFTSVEEMNNDSNKQKNDLALIYNDESTYLSIGILANNFIFPETITLDHTYSSEDSNIVIIRSLDEESMLHIELQESSCYCMGNFPDGQVWINYSSSDGYTYTRTDFEADTAYATIKENVLSFTKSMKIDESYLDNGDYTNANRFLLISEHQMHGLYQAMSVDNPNSIEVLRGYTSLSKDDMIYEDVKINSTAVKDFMNKLNTDYSVTLGVLEFTDTTLKMHVWDSRTCGIMNDGVLYLGAYTTSSITSAKTITTYTYNIETAEITTSTASSETISFPWTETSVTQSILNTTDKDWTIMRTADCSIGSTTDSYYDNKLIIWTPATTGGTSDAVIQYSQNIYEYKPADNQYTLNNANQLLPGVIGYGKGIFVGDDTIYDNLDSEQLKTNVMQIENTINMCSLKNTTDTFSATKLYGFRLDDQGKYGESLASYRTTKTMDISSISGTGMYNFGYICVYKNKLYVFTDDNTTTSYNEYCSVYDIDENWNFTYVKTISWTDSLSKHTTNSFVEYDNGKVYIALSKGVGSGGTYVELQIVDLDAMIVTKKGYKQITSSTVYGCYPWQIDIANTTVYTSNYLSGGDPTIYTWNWTSGTVTKRSYVNTIPNSMADYTFHSTYTYDCVKSTTETSKYNTIRIISKTANSVSKTLTTPLSSDRPRWFVVDDIAYFYCSTYMMKVDLSTLTIIATNEFDTATTTVSTSYYSRTNSGAVIDGDMAYTVVNTSTSLTGNLMVLNLADLTYNYYLEPNGYSAASILLADVYVKRITLSMSSSKITGTYCEDILRLGSIDDFGNGLIGMVLTQDYSPYKFGVSTTTPHITDILSIPIPYMTTYNTALETAQDILGKEETVNE